MNSGYNNQSLIGVEKYITKYRLAVEEGNLEHMQNLEKENTHFILPMIGDCNFSAFRMAAEMGRIDMLTHLENVGPKITMIKAGWFGAYFLAARNGHINVLKHLKNVVPHLLLDMIRSQSFRPYRCAAEHGQIHVMEYLEAEVPDLVSSMIKADNFYGYSGASREGHLHILEHLEKKAPQYIQQMIAANNFGAFKGAYNCNRVEIIQHLCSQSSSCLEYATTYQQNLAKSTFEDIKVAYGKFFTHPNTDELEFSNSNKNIYKNNL